MKNKIVKEKRIIKNQINQIKRKIIINRIKKEKIISMMKNKRRKKRKNILNNMIGNKMKLKTYYMKKISLKVNIKNQLNLKN
jgi:hypothetical protein